jgi:hypothetical protein
LFLVSNGGTSVMTGLALATVRNFPSNMDRAHLRLKDVRECRVKCVRAWKIDDAVGAARSTTL